MKASKSTVTVNVTPKRLVSIEDVVSEYGGTKSLWRTRIWRRELEYVQIGRKFFFERRDLDDFIQKCKRLA